MRYTLWILLCTLVCSLTAIRRSEALEWRRTAYGEGNTLEVIYRWQTPMNIIDQVVYQRFKQTIQLPDAYYYYAMYARSKDDILISQVPYKYNQAWVPERILLNGEEIRHEAYIKLIELSPPEKYHIIYYQNTPDGVMKLGEQPAAGLPYISDVRFVDKLASEIGQQTEFTLWHFVGPAAAAAGFLEYKNREKKPPNLAPIAGFNVTPQRGTLSSPFYFDASPSYDLHEDSSNHLVFRWDWENDGYWDTSYSFTKTASHAYTAPGAYTVKLEVFDWANTTTAYADLVVINNGPALMSSPSPMFRISPQHTGLSTLAGPSQNTIKWSFQTNGPIISSPAIDAANNIYIGSYDGHLYKINPGGLTLWAYPVNGIIHSSAAIASDGTVYIGSGNGLLYAINSDGTLKWSHHADSALKSSPAIAPDGTIYIGTVNGALYAVNYDGTLKWTRHLGSLIESSPAVAADGTIYIGTYNGLYAVNPDSTIKWSFLSESAILSSAAIAADGAIYFGSSDHHLYALNPQGEQLWRYETGGSIVSSPAIAADGKIYVGSNDNYLYSLNPNGTLNWSRLSGSVPITSGSRDGNTSPVLDSSGNIYIGSCDGNFHSVNTMGVANWTLPITASSTAAIANPGASPMLYVGCDDYKLYAIGSAPIDPASIIISKTANKQRVSVGDLVTYRISITNLGAPPAPGPTTETYINDRIPAGFKYVRGTTVLDGVKLNERQTSQPGAQTWRTAYQHDVPNKGNFAAKNA